MVQNEYPLESNPNANASSLNRWSSALILWILVFGGFSPLGAQEEEGPVQGPTLPDTTTEIEERVKKSIAQLSRWPAKVAQDRALKLSEEGPEVAPWIRGLLDHRRERVRASACWILGRVGTRRDFDDLKKTLMDPSMRRYGFPVLDGMAQLDREEARELAFDLLRTEKAPHRSAARRLLETTPPNEAERGRLLDILRTKDRGIRRDAFKLLRAWGGESLVDQALDYLDSSDNRLRREAFRCLREILRAPGDDLDGTREKALATFRQAVSAGMDLKANASILLLIELADFGMGEGLPKECLPILEKGLVSLDPSLRATCALGFYWLGYQFPVLGLQDRMVKDGFVPLATTLFQSPNIDHFSEILEIASPLIRRSLQIELTPTLVSWEKPLREQESMVARMRFETEPTSHDDLELRWVPKGADSREILGEKTVRFRGPNVAASDTSEMEFLLDSDERQELLDTMRAQGVFDGALAPRSQSGEPTFSLNSRDRSLDLSSGANRPDDQKALLAIEAVALALMQANRWQAYPPENEGSFVQFWSSEIAWREERNDSEKRARTLQLVEQFLTKTRIERQRLRLALDDATALVRDGAELSPKGIRALIRVAITQPKLDEIVRHAIELLGTSDDPLLFAPLADALLDRYGPDGEMSVCRLMKSLDQVGTSIGHPDSRIRALAVGVWAEIEPERYELLVSCLEDNDSRVQAAAAEALGRLGTQESGEALLTLARKASRESVRAAALTASGKVGVEGATEALLAASRSPRSRIQIAAVRGMGYRRDPRVFDELITLFVENGPRSSLGVVAAESLRMLSGSEVREKLLPLSFSSEGSLGLETKFLLAELGETRMLRSLLDLTEEEAHQTRARQAITRLTCRDLGEAQWLYKTFIEAELSFEALFVDGLEATGIRAEDLAGETANREIAVPFLLNHLEDPRWYIRDGARVLIREFSDISGPLIPRNANPKRLSELRRDWERCFR